MWIANEGMKRCSTSLVIRELRVERTVRASRWPRGRESGCRCQRRVCNPWSRKIARAAEQLSPRATAPEPVLWNLGPIAAEPTCCDCRSPWGSNLRCTTREAVAAEEGPLTATAREGPHRNEGLAQPPIKMKPQWAITTHLLRWKR